jgi:hypothetical protein
MNRKEKQEIVTRWTKQKISEVEDYLNQDPIDHEALAKMVGFVPNTSDPRIDLRAYPLPTNFLDKKLMKIDLEGSNWEKGRFLSVHATRCSFAKCTLKCPLAIVFDECDFRESRIINVLVAPGTKFVNCNFNGASFRGGNFYQGLFENCTFQESKLRSVEFEDCVFDGCDFVGCDFKKVWFGHSNFFHVKNNFTFLDDEYAENKLEKVVDENLPMVDFGDSEGILEAKIKRTKRY